MLAHANLYLALLPITFDQEKNKVFLRVSGEVREIIDGQKLLLLVICFRIFSFTSIIALVTELNKKTIGLLLRPIQEEIKYFYAKSH